MSHRNHIQLRVFFFLYSSKIYKPVKDYRAQEVKCCSECIRLVDDKLCYLPYMAVHYAIDVYPD